MNLSSLLVIPLASAGLLAASPTLPTVETPAQLKAFLAQLDEGMDQPAQPAAKAAPHVSKPAGLGSPKLQMASGLHSTARGLTGKNEWNGQFPRYAKRK